MAGWSDSSAIRGGRRGGGGAGATTSNTTFKPPPTPANSNSKASRNAANFECNVCFDMAADPVVTSCGHLFCWECLYQWLHVHSHHRECPVCEGQLADDAIIPIYGRGGSAASLESRAPGSSSLLQTGIWTTTRKMTPFISRRFALALELERGAAPADHSNIVGRVMMVNLESPSEVWKQEAIDFCCIYKFGHYATGYPRD